MNYFWGTCAACGCQVTIQFAEAPDRLDRLASPLVDRPHRQRRPKDGGPARRCESRRGLPDSLRLRRRGRRRRSGDRARDDGTF